jgi:chromosome segregation ATPase
MGSRWRDIAREYKRQKEKLDLLTQELQIQRDEQAIEWKRAAKKGLKDNLQALESSVRDLEKQWSTRSSHWGWRSWTIAKQLELLRIMSKLKKQPANLVKAWEQIPDTLKSIQEMEASVLAVKSNFESAKSRYRSQGAEEECCKSQIEALSKAVNQLELWKRETSVAKEELKAVTRLLKDCQKQKETYGRDLESIEMKHQTANRRIQEQGADMETVRTKLSSAHNGVCTLLSEVVMA